MNSQDVLAVLESGGQVSERWKLRHFFSQKAKKIITLHYPNGGQVHIQRSMLTPLFKQGLILTTALSGKEYIYRMKVIE